MNEKLQEIGEVLADIHELTEGLQAVCGDNDGCELWQIAEVAKGLAGVVHGLAKDFYSERGRK